MVAASLIAPLATSDAYRLRSPAPGSSTAMTLPPVDRCRARASGPAWWDQSGRTEASTSSTTQSNWRCVPGIET